MSKDKPAITPEMTVAELLDAYPGMEESLIALSPAFAKLKTPVLQKTIARITTLRQAARVADVSLGGMINILRAKAGDLRAWSEEPEASDGAAGLPAGFSEEAVIETFDAVELVNSGGHPVGQVLAALRDLPSGKFYALIAPFEPAPLMDKARDAGMEAFAERQAEDRYRVIFWRRNT